MCVVFIMVLVLCCDVLCDVVVIVDSLFDLVVLDSDEGYV